jgi:uncharacterized protein (TIGR02466 family)
MQSFAYFPSLVYRDEHPEWVDYTLKVAQKHFDWTAQNRPEEQKDWPLTQTNHMANDPEIKFLVDYLLAEGNTILRAQGYDVDKYELYLSGLWAQDVKGNGGTNVHIHKNSQVCGWFFLETPEGGAYPIYHDVRMNKQMVELDYVQGGELTNASSTVHFNNVVPGTVLFANSWMQHQLTHNASQKQTKSVHFIISHKDKAPQCNT